ncbi:MAG: NADH-quinone oxidoreductase subunit NuoE [Nitratireductor sp.]
MSDATFEFDGKFLAEAERNIAKYPHERRQSAVLALLFLAQEQNHENGRYVTEAMMRKIAEMLGMPYIRVMEVATFFTQINLAPVGTFHIQLCGTTPCMLRGAVALREGVEAHLGIKTGGTTDDGMFTLTEVECLGACCNAPMVQINDDYYEDLTVESLTEILDALKRGERPTPGSQIGRRCSEPEGGPMVLKDGPSPQGPAQPEKGPYGNMPAGEPEKLY